MTRAESNIVLFSITLCWASSYLFVKNLPPDLSPFAYMTMTSGLAFIILAIVFFARLRDLKGRVLWRSAILAAIVCFNLVFERLGVSRIPASTASFVASLTIVFVPLFLLLLKQRPTKNNVLGIPFILAGLVLTSGVQRGVPLELGVLYMVAACIFMAIYVIVVDGFTKNDDPLLLGIGQMLWVAVIAYLLWLVEEPRTFFALTYTNEMLASIFLLAFFARAYAYIMLMYGQRYANPISVTVIASTEPVVTMVLALLIPDTFGQTESFTFAKLVGGVLIVIGAICAGTDFLDNPDLLNRLRLGGKGEKGVAAS